MPVKDDQDRRLAVGKAGIAEVLDPVGDFSDIRQVDRRAVAIGNDQGPIIVGLVGLVIGVNLLALVADIDAAFRAVGIGARQRGTNVFQTDPVFVERLRNEVDAHRRQRAAADPDLADAFDL